MKIKQYLIDQAIIWRNFFQVSLPLRHCRSAKPTPPKADTATRFVIFAADPSNPSGSLGDIAMLTGVIHALREINPDSTFTIIGTKDHNMAIPGIGDIPVVAAWIGKAGTMAFDTLIRENHALFVMGADVLDGKYGGALVQRIVSYCNHSVALGIPATILGFSFNRSPRRPAVHAFASLHSKVTVNVRGQASLDRFVRITGTPATLCADCAFLMAPSSEPEPETETWIAAMRNAGRTPIGLNLNTHALAPALAQMSMDTLIANIADQLRRAGTQHALAFMLIPHDLKTQSGDITMLLALEKELQKRDFPHVRYTQINRPDIIKRIVGQLDLVITGRMHLAIASIGAGTPILSMAYQDKFEDLYRHAGLSFEHTLTPMQCLNDTFLEKIDTAFNQRLENRERIRSHLPQIKMLALRNLVMAKC